MDRDEILKRARNAKEDEGEKRLVERSIDMQLTAMLAASVLIMIFNLALRFTRGIDLSMATNSVWAATVCGLAGSMYGRWRAGDHSKLTRNMLILNCFSAILLLTLYALSAMVE